MIEILNYFDIIKEKLLIWITPITLSEFNLILLFIIIIILIVNSINKRKITKKIKKIPSFKLNEKISFNLKNINEQLAVLKVHKTHSENVFTNIFNLLNNKVKTIKSKKYNPYTDMGVGGNQSFSIALIGKNGDGIIITSLYSRERTRLLLKIINNFVPEQELTKEEMEVLNETKK